MTASNPHDLALDAYLAAFAAHGFAGATLASAAAAGELSVAAIAPHVAGRWEAVDRFNRRLDLAALAAAVADPAITTKDRLFDLAMARFDALQPHRAAALRLADDARTRPGLALALVAQLGRTANMLLGAAGVETSGARGIATINAFAAILADVGRAWARDDDADLGQTMRALDKRLERAAACARRCGGRDSAPASVSARDGFDPAGAL